MDTPQDMTRVNLRWTIEGIKGTQTGMLYGLHEQEVAVALANLKRRARRGDTLTTQTWAA